MNNIVFVAGYICSGKTYHANEIADNKDYDMIEVSSIVREILDTNERTELQGHPELEDQIIDRIQEIVKTTKKNGIVISGPRQLKIIQAFPEADCIWMNTTLKNCFERFQSRADSKDGETTFEAFEEYLMRDEELGLDEVKNYMRNKNEKN